MKTQQKLIGAMRSIAVAAFVAAIVFALTGCDNPAGPGGNPFIGAWTGASMTLEFTSTTWTITTATVSGSGPYTYNGNTATLTDSGGAATATISGNTLTFTNRNGSATLTRTGGGGGGGPSGQTNGWPPSNVRNNYGIGGLNQPPGSNFLWAETSSGGVYVIEIIFTPTNNTLPTLETWFTSNGGWSTMVVSGATMWIKGEASVTYQIQPNGKALISGRKMNW